MILDEIGRGTSTFDGISLAWAVTEHIHDTIGCRTLFATHYHELVELEKTKPRLRNANVAVREKEGEIVFLYQIVPGGADQSYGIHVARLAGVPAPVLERAREILKFLEKQHGPDPGIAGRADSPQGQDRPSADGEPVRGAAGPAVDRAKTDRNGSDHGRSCHRSDPSTSRARRLSRRTRAFGAPHTADPVLIRRRRPAAMKICHCSGHGVGRHRDGAIRGSVSLRNRAGNRPVAQLSLGLVRFCSCRAAASLR